MREFEYKNAIVVPFPVVVPELLYPLSKASFDPPDATPKKPSFVIDASGNVKDG